MTPKTSLFLLAHQDDEFGAFDIIRRAAAHGHARCVYFTDGAAGGDPERRNRESLAVLRRLGVPEDDVQFFGVSNGIADGKLLESLPVVAQLITDLLAELPDDTPIYLAAWEGGHHDHDGLHAVTATLLAQRGMLDRARQFALYHGYRCPGPFFRVLSPLARNGPVTTNRLDWGNRLRYLRHCLRYPSQAVTWIGLFPFAAVQLLLRGRQSLQPIDIARCAERPHAGKLYYEKRGFLEYPQLALAIQAWQQSLQA